MNYIMRAMEWLLQVIESGAHRAKLSLYRRRTGIVPLECPADKSPVPQRFLPSCGVDRVYRAIVANEGLSPVADAAIRTLQS